MDGDLLTLSETNCDSHNSNYKECNQIDSFTVEFIESNNNVNYLLETDIENEESLIETVLFEVPEQINENNKFEETGQPNMI